MRRTMIVAIGLAMAVATAQAGMTFSFDSITNNTTGNPGLGEAQLRMMVSDLGSGQVQFDFFHAGSVDMSITQIYFDDLAIPLMSFVKLIDSDDNGGDAGVDYSPNGAPSNLPSGTNASPAFVTSYYYTADSTGGVESNGVNPTETLGIVFNGTYASVIAGLLSGDLRVGLHVQAIDGPVGLGSESFVHTPAPGALLLGAIGLALIRGVTDRRWLN